MTLESTPHAGMVDEDPYPLLDLTCLLTTGRTSEALLDYLGSGEHMSERVGSRFTYLTTPLGYSRVV